MGMFVAALGKLFGLHGAHGERGEIRPGDLHAGGRDGRGGSAGGVASSVHWSMYRASGLAPGCSPYPQRGQLARTVRKTPQRKPLRIVHGNAGRLVISGRMADVCAELDRLAALEAQALAPAR
jgi:hypothetical protein